MSSFIDAELRRSLKSGSVGITEFAESSDYCGKPLYPLQTVFMKLVFLEEMTGQEEDLLTWMINGGRNGEITLSRDIRERRDWCRDQGYEHFGQIELVGGRRSSKGYITALAGTYKLWKVQSIPDPGAFYGMDIDKQIEFTCIAAAFEQAKTRQFADFYSVITRCKALEPYLSKRQEEMITIRCQTDIDNIASMQANGIKIARDFAKLRVLPLAANADTLRGSASIFTVFDEMAFMMPGESRSSAQQVYTAAEPSLAQFGYHALVFANSSPYTKIGMFYNLVEQALRPLDRRTYEKEVFPMRFAFKFPSWALYDKWWLTENENIHNAIMVSPNWKDQLEVDEPKSKLDKISLGKRQSEQLKEKANPDTYKVEYRANWAEVLDAYLSPEKVDRAYNGILPDGRPNAMSNSGTYLFDYAAHCDPSSTTAGFGFALGHVEEFPDLTGMWPDGLARHVVFDRVMRWSPTDFAEGVINYIKVKDDLAHIVELYSPKIITFDQYNSAGLMQELRDAMRKRGEYDTRIAEVTATQAVNWNRWEAFKTALYLDLVHIPPDCIFGDFDHSEYSSQELKFLQEIQTGQTKRVDKQTMGPIQTKDIADCIAEVTYKFLSSYLGDLVNKNFGLAKLKGGSEGGYQIGGRTPGGPDPTAGQSKSRFGEFYGSRSSGNNNPSSARGIRDRGRR